MTHIIEFSISDELYGLIKEYDANHGSKGVDRMLSSILCTKLQKLFIDAKYCFVCNEIKHLSSFHSIKQHKCIKCDKETQRTKLAYTSHNARILAKQKCVLCGNTTIDVHHIVPRSMGGKDCEDNLIALCFDCHLKAHNGDFSNRHGINEELQSRLKEINKNQVSASKLLDPVQEIKKLRDEALSNQQSYKSPKYKKFFSGKCQAFQETIELLGGV